MLAEKLQEQLDDQKNRKAVKKILEEKRMALQLEQVLSNNRKAEKQLEDQREVGPATKSRGDVSLPTNPTACWAGFLYFLTNPTTDSTVKC